MNNYNKFVAITATSIMMILSIGIAVLPKKDFSENENRVLKGKPQFSKEKLLSGEFMDDIENYMNDHFPGRDKLVSIKGNFQQLLGYREMNGTFLVGDRLLQHIDKPNTKAFASKFNRLEGNLADYNGTLSLMMVPTDAGVYDDLLPANAPDVVDEKEAIQYIYNHVSCQTVDVLTALKKEKENNNVFYNLDHHWSYYGAYIGYKTYMESIGLTPAGLDEIKCTTVSDDFRGTLYSKVLIDSMASDSIVAPDLSGLNLTVTNVDKKEVRQTYYYDEFLKQKDKYCYFGGGNPAKMTIENPDAKNDRELLIVKDSYANSLIPFLVRDFKKIHILDPRYYVRHISDYAKSEEGITDILVLYNLDSLNTNSGIVKLK